MAYWAVENQDKNLSGENYFRCSTKLHQKFDNHY